MLEGRVARPSFGSPWPQRMSPPLHGSDSQDEEDLEIEDDDDVREDAAALFGIDVGDDGVPNNNVNVIDVDTDAGDGGGAAAEPAGCYSIDTQGTTTSGKRKSSV